MRIVLKSDRKRRLEQGHPWVFSSEIMQVEGDPKPGDVVEIVNTSQHFLAKGYYNGQSQIAVRVLTYRQEEQIDGAFFRRRIEQAWQYRLRLLPDARDAQACRIVFGEADFLPGLIVDKFESMVVLQCLSQGIERQKGAIVKAIRDVLRPTGIYERSDVSVREREGLEPIQGLLWGELENPIEISEHGLKMWVDIVDGQKTGYFFDQRENRAAIAPLVRFAADEKPRLDQRYRKVVDKSGGGGEGETDHRHSRAGGRRGADVLECFAHTGSFTVHACEYGANHVTCLDSSETAIEMARRNISLNGFDDRVDLIVANAFDQLRVYERDKRIFDVVILDPPAFAKSRSATDSALRGYKEINLRGMKLLKDGGFLVTSSCSSYVDREQWLGAIGEAAVDAHKILRQVEYRGAGKDHPQIVGVAEGDYLKFAMFEVRGR